MKNILVKLFLLLNQITLRINLKELIFEQISGFIVKYGSAITIEALNIEVDNRTDLTETEVKE